MSSLPTFLGVFITSLLLPAQRNRIEIDGCFCYFCKCENASHKAHRFTTISSLLHHIQQAHNQESKSDLNFVLEIIKFVSYAVELGMVRQGDVFRMKNTKPDRCCSQMKKPIHEITYDVGTEGERVYLICANHIFRKPFNMYIKSQKLIGEENGQCIFHL